ncbi:MAG: hypothetical protein ACJAYJ_002726 [Saprospiraceae bacterium]|jgi:hypothetical protein
MLFLTIGFSLVAQTFAPPFQGFSRKKTTFITLKDGTEISVFIKNLKFKKGLIDELKVSPANGGKKVKINPEDISHMYIPPSDMAKLYQILDAATDLTKLQDNELSTEHLDDGYLYMESSQVQVKKKKVQYCMLQVMNPTFSKKIKVYNDPLSNETVSIGIGGMKLAGGLAKSYYIKKEGEAIARRIKKKEYKKDMDEVFSECSSVIKKYGADPTWSEFEDFIYDYSTECK